VSAGLAAAHQYAEVGWPVFPCIPGEKAPATSHGLLDATTDHRQIDKWWKRNPERNVAVATGAPGPDVVDVDHHGERGNGFGAWNQAKREGLVANPQALVRTPGGGMHAYFRGTEQRSAKITGQHLDFRGHGGYVVAPPSTVAGRRYEVVHHQASAATVDFGAVRRLLEPERPAQARWAPARGGQPRDLDHLVRYVAECTDHVNDRLYWAACRMAEAGQHDRLPELVRAAYEAGEDRRGQAERTVESALCTVSRGGRPFVPEREAD
jgi:bifunctional DNA primase/polymerase-like protein